MRARGLALLVVTGALLAPGAVHAGPPRAGGAAGALRQRFGERRAMALGPWEHALLGREHLAEGEHQHALANGWRGDEDGRTAARAAALTSYVTATAHALAERDGHLAQGAAVEARAAEAVAHRSLGMAHRERAAQQAAAGHEPERVARRLMRGSARLARAGELDFELAHGIDPDHLTRAANSFAWAATLAERGGRPDRAAYLRRREAVALDHLAAVTGVDEHRWNADLARRAARRLETQAAGTAAQPPPSGP